MSEIRARRQIPLSEPTFAGRELEYVKECLESGWVSTQGPKVRAFEQAIADYTGAREAVACVNGTAAIHLALIGAGIKAGDEVIMPSLTFVGSVNPVFYLGAVPVFADVDAATLTISPDAVIAVLKDRYRRGSDGRWASRDGRPLGALLAVDLYGHPVDYDSLSEAVLPYGIPIVEDAAEALGATCRGRSAGRLGEVSALSFNGNKVITTGGGGMILTDDAVMASRLRHLSTQARSDSVEYVHDAVGFNYRLTNIQAALGLAQLEQLDGFLARKRALHTRYQSLLARYGGVTVIAEQPWARSSYWLASILIESLAGSRQLLHDVVRRLAGEHIEVRPFFTPVHEQPAYVGQVPTPLTTTAEVFARGMNLPSSAALEMNDADIVVEALVRHARLTARPS